MKPEAATFETVRPDDYLLRLAATDEARAYKKLAIPELGILGGDTVLDIGCGPGTDLPDMAAAASPAGVVIGLDSDSVALARAAGRVHGLPQVRITRCDAHGLDIADDSIDRAHTDRVLQHLADPLGALREVKRVLRPGGTAVFAEPDWDTLVIDYPDLAIARAYARFVADRVVPNGCIGRQLPAFASSVGLVVRGVIPITSVSRDATAADKVLGLQRVTERAASAGYFTPEQARLWLDYLAKGPFFASMTLFIVVTTKVTRR
jgi:ubiquinone/menaquinone biosynthesis C-methylase UbiE